MTDELQALLANLPELKVVQHCLAGGDKPVDTVKLDPIQRRALGSMERKHGEAIVAAVNWCRTERPALIAEVDALREALTRSGQGWANAIELGLIPPQHRNTAQILADEARAALGASHDAK